jgi:hypothetical protein
MTVNLTLSETLGGYSMPDTTDLGSASPSSAVGHQDIFISHDAEVSSITSCAIYLSRYSGSSYPGTDEDADFTQIMGWGDSALGGVEMSMTPDSPWTTGNKFAAGWAYFKNGYGDVNNQIPLDKDSIVVGSVPSEDGIIPVGGTSHIQIDIDIPASPGSTGIKAFTMVFAYSATS